MNDQGLADRIRRLAPTTSDADWAEVVQRAGLVASEPRKSQRRIWVFAGAVTVALGAVAVAFLVTDFGGGSSSGAQTSSAVQPHCSGLIEGQPCQAFLKSHPLFAANLRREAAAASQSTPGSTGVRTLVAYRRLMNAVSADALPANVSQMISHQEQRLTAGQSPSGIQEPIIGNPSRGTPSVYLVSYPNHLCTIIAIKGAVAGCNSALRVAHGSISLQDTIVDGKRFIFGLAANDVRSVNVVLAMSATTRPRTFKATIENNVFIAPLPYGGGIDLGQVTVTITHMDGTKSMTTLGAGRFQSTPGGRPGLVFESPPNAAQLVANAENRFGVKATAQKPVIGTPSLYPVKLGTSPPSYCLYIVIGSKATGCQAPLHLNGSLLDAQGPFILNGKAFVVGVTASNARSLKVVVASTSTTPRKIIPTELVNGFFLIALPYDDGKVGAVTVTAYAGDTTETMTQPGLP